LPKLASKVKCGSKEELNMTITEKFATLTPEQREKFNAVKDGAGLDVFISETSVEITDEEKLQILSYIESGKLPLADEELDNVAGGFICNPQPPKFYAYHGMKYSDECKKCGSRDIVKGYPIQCRACGYEWLVDSSRWDD
jgi:hypothetical protein